MSSSLKKLLEEYFGTSELYEVLGLDKTAKEKEIKKAYYNMSLKIHPDRVSQQEKALATEKFKLLSKIHTILSDKDKRAVYDETGTYDDDDDGNTSERNWLQYWRKLFRKITDQDINDFEKTYKGSETEKTDLKRVYLEGKGCINRIMDSIPFAQAEEEPRLIGILQQMIDEEIIPEYDIFTNEPAAKRKRRHRIAAKEAKEVELFKKKERESLTVAIQNRQSQRELNFLDILDKYENVAKSSKRKNPTKNTTATGRSSKKRRT